MKVDKALGMIGLATKAGKIASGEFMTENAVKSGMASLVIVSAEASDNTKKNSEICVSFIMCRLKNVGRKLNSEKQQVKHFGHLWR